MGVTFNGRLIAPYQQDGVREMKAMESRGKGGILADEMGLGKTVELLAMCVALPVVLTLVVCPLSLVDQWIDHVDRFIPAATVQVGEFNEELIRRFNIVIVTYGLLKNRLNKFLGVRWGRVILDEAHMIKNPKSSVCKAVMRLNVDKRWCATGTPVPNKIRDYKTLLTFVGIEDFQDIENVRHTHVIRRTKADITKFAPRLELPPMTIHNCQVTMLPAEQDAYKKIFHLYREKINDWRKMGTLKMHSMEILEMVLRLRQCLISPTIVSKEKTETFPSKFLQIEKILNSQHRTDKTLIFCHFHSEMDMMEELLVRNNIDYDRIDGRDPLEVRTSSIDSFGKTDCRVLILQMEVGSVGLNLWMANNVILTSPCWNPSTELQAIARAHRTGQTRCVTVYRLIAVNESPEPSIDVVIGGLQHIKSIRGAKMLGDERLVSQLPTSSCELSISDICGIMTGKI
ncbi:MAG: hypothetical protein CMM25_05950 [Rhodospirillaceae bacterium]|mgnify:CR=1 FL=1|nr:hypothetical protein [Rhodospirillaceae bacterium]